MIIRPFLFALLFAFACLNNANAYVEGSLVTDISQQEILSESESEVFQLEQIAEREHPQQRRRWCGRRPCPYPYPPLRRGRRPYPYPPPIFVPSVFIPFPIFMPTYDLGFSPYCSYRHHGYVNLPEYLISGLFTAICDGETRRVRVIIRRGVSPHQPWVTGETPLMVAAQTGNFRLVKILVEEFDVDLLVRDKWGHRAADWAHENNERRIEDYLASPYCDYHSSELPRRLRNRLFTAICDVKEIRRVRVIIRRGVSPHEPWVTGETPLMMAAQTGNFELVKILIEEFSVDWTETDKWSNTAADWAYDNDYDDIGDYLRDLR